MNENSFNLNDFQLLDKIGEGSYGKVYKIKDRTTKIIYAAKKSNKELDDSDEVSIDIYQEVSILSQLNHPSVLKFIGYSPINFKQKNKPVIITEYVKNGSLKDLLKEQSNPKSIVNWNGTLKLIMLYGIANAMAYLHQHKIIIQTSNKLKKKII